MKNQNNEKIKGFWVGFSAGIGSAAILGFLFGTKKGREVLKKGILFSENLEENVYHVINHFDSDSAKKKGKTSKTPPFIENVESILGKIKNIANSS